MTKIIKILGTGCPKCKATIALVEEVVKENNIDAEIIKVDDIMDIMEYDVLSTPAVVIDEKIMVKGRVPSKEEVKKLLDNPFVIGLGDENNGDSCCSDDNGGGCC